MVVSVTVAEPQTVDDHRMIEHRPIAVRRRSEPFEKRSKARPVEMVDLGQLGDLYFVAFVMRDAVAGVGNADRSNIRSRRSANWTGMPLGFTISGRQRENL